MREILFRGKRVDNSEWVEGNLFIPDLKNSETQICIGTCVVRICYAIDPETVGQFTGLLDKNGKKIFEGDIVKYRRVAHREIVYKVVWQQEFSRFVFATCSTHGYNLYEWAEESKGKYMCEIIGNIHDNPELLEVKK